VAKETGASTRIDARRGRQRERILAAAEDLLVENGVERTRLRDVAAAAGVSIGTVQYYFATRDRLVEELFDWSAGRRLEHWVALEPGLADAWRRIETLLEHALAEPLLRRSRTWIEFLAMARDDELRARLGVFYEAWRRPLREAIEEGIAAGQFRPALPVDGLVDLLIMMVDGAEVATVLGAPGLSRELLLATHVAAARTLLGVRLAAPVEASRGAQTPRDA
jgi:AcrR family transcriptional regulator